MAGGWSRDGAVQEQIDASVEDEIQRARSQLAKGENAEECDECGAPIPEARRKAIPGVRLFTPPTYSHIYNLKTVQMSNDKGTWFGWDVSKVGPIEDKSVYDIAKGFADQVGKGEIQAKHGSEESKTDSPY